MTKRFTMSQKYQTLVGQSRVLALCVKAQTYVYTLKLVSYKYQLPTQAARIRFISQKFKEAASRRPASAHNFCAQKRAAGANTLARRTLRAVVSR
jgi:hypothetical protein